MKCLTRSSICASFSHFHFFGMFVLNIPSRGYLVTLALGTCIMVLGSKCLQLTRPDEFVLVSHMHMKLGVSKQRVLVVVVFLATYAVTQHAWKTDVFRFFSFKFWRLFALNLWNVCFLKLVIFTLRIHWYVFPRKLTYALKANGWKMKFPFLNMSLFLGGHLNFKGAYMLMHVLGLGTPATSPD